MAIELYPHNQSTYEKMIEMFRSSNRVGVVQPTGTGKSFLYLKWIEDHLQDSLLFFPLLPKFSPSCRSMRIAPTLLSCSIPFK